MTTNTILKTGLGALALTLVAACASAGTTETAKADEPDERRGERVDRICFNRSIDSFSNTQRRSVVLQAAPGREYLVETGSCAPLRSAQRIALDSTGSCLSRGDKLIVSENFFGGRDKAGLDVDRCYVRAIYEWDRKGDKEKS